MRRSFIVKASLFVAAVAAIGLAVWLLFWRRRRAEGLVSQEHTDLILKWCASGKSLNSLFKQNPELKSYKEKAVRRMCRLDGQRWRSMGSYQSAVELDRCGGRRMCDRASVRVTHPCLNQAGTKCCLYGDKWSESAQNCVDRGNGVSYDEYKKHVVDSDTKMTTTWSCMRDNKRIGATFLEATRSEATRQCNADPYFSPKCEGKCQAFAGDDFRA